MDDACVQVLDQPKGWDRREWMMLVCRFWTSRKGGTGGLGGG